MFIKIIRYHNGFTGLSCTHQKKRKKGVDIVCVKCSQKLEFPGFAQNPRNKKKYCT